MICFASYKIFGTDETDHGVDQQRRVAARETVASRLERDLVGALVRAGGKLGALPGFEVHQVGRVERAALANRAIGVIEHRDVDAETAAGFLGPGQALKKNVHRRASFERAHLGRDMTEHAVLRRHAGAFDNVGGEFEQAAHIVGFVDARIDADQRVASAVSEAFIRGARDPVGIVARMIGLKPRRETAGQSERGASLGDDANFRGDRDQIEIRAKLGDCGGDLGGDAAASREDRVAGRCVIEQPFAKLADGLVGDLFVRAAIERVIDDTRHLIAFICHHRVFAQVTQRQIRENNLRRDALLLGARRDTGEFIAGTRLIGARENVLDGFELVGFSEQARRKFHGPTLFADSNLA